MKNKKFPDILKFYYGNWRLFKMIKRAEIRSAIKEYDHVVCASAFIPREAYRLTNRISEDLRSVQQLLSEKEWGR